MSIITLSLICMKREELDFGFPLHQTVETQRCNGVLLRINRNCSSPLALKKVSSCILGWLNLIQSTYIYTKDTSIEVRFSGVMKARIYHTKYSFMLTFVWINFNLKFFSPLHAQQWYSLMLLSNSFWRLKQNKKDNYFHSVVSTKP